MNGQRIGGDGYGTSGGAYTQRGMSSTGMLRLAREMKLVKRDPPDILYAIKMLEESEMAQPQRNALERPTYFDVGLSASASASISDSRAEMRFVIRGPDGTHTYIHTYEYICIMNT